MLYVPVCVPYYVPVCEPYVPVYVAPPVEALEYLEERLAPGSHVVLVGLIDAGFLYRVGRRGEWERREGELYWVATLIKDTPYANSRIMNSRIVAKTQKKTKKNN